jgi:RNA polymerase sigma factor (sigma-70 family)
MVGVHVDTLTVDQDAVLVADRARLVRLCTQITGDAHAAEDLAQETLLVALQQEQALRDPAKRAQWLSGIARNLCLHWRRRKGLERTKSVQPSSREDALPSDGDDLLADNCDLEIELERGELVDLLDRAMALLPAETREVLIERYVQELPHADVAARLGLSEEAVKKRVERGKLALKRLLTTELRQEALSLGLIAPGAESWQETRIWCPGCGRHRLEGRFRPDEGELYMRCPGCSLSDTYYIAARMGDRFFKDIRTYRPAVTRLLGFIHDLFRLRPIKGAVLCPNCQEWLPIRRGLPPWCPSQLEGLEATYLRCPGCGFYDGETWHSLTWSLPEARRFWQEHPRMRSLAEREIEVAGSPAVVTGFESLTGSARLEVVALRDTCRVVSINGVVPPAAERG